MTNTLRILGSVIAVAAASLAPLVQAKLPAPSDEAKAAAAVAADKSAWSNKVAAYQLCKVQDRIAERVRSAGKDVKPATPTPTCADPGPYVAAQAKPIEAAGAHSPAATATSPPSTQQPAAVVDPVKKP